MLRLYVLGASAFAAKVPGTMGTCKRRWWRTESMSIMDS